MSSESKPGAGGTPSGVDADAAVELRGVRRTYRVGEPVHALDGVDLTIPQGSYTAVMGPSGSGKSTLMNLVGCLDTPTEGAIYLDGREVTATSDRERTQIRGEEVGFVFQTFNLVPRMTARENVAMPLVFQGVGRAERNRRADELLERVGLADRAGHRPNELSGGQRQRVAIARALVADPALLLADEPTGNLDTETGAAIMDLFEELHAEGNTVVMVTHERHVAGRAERVVHLLDGNVERIEELDGVGADGNPPGGAVDGGSGGVVGDGPGPGDGTDDAPGSRDGDGPRSGGDDGGDPAGSDDARGEDDAWREDARGEDAGRGDDVRGKGDARGEDDRS